MSYIITGKNYGDIKKMMREVRYQAEASTDRFHRYASEHLYIIGEDLFNLFCHDYGVEKLPSVSAIDGRLKNNSTIAEVVAIYYTEYNYYADSASGSFDRVWRQAGIIVDGEILLASFYRRETTAQLSFLDDKRIYHQGLPYKWEEQNPHPNQVGLLTDKKVQAWLDWLRLRRDTYDAKVNAENDAVAAFLERVRAIDCGCKKQIGEDRGYLVKNNIRFSYTISDRYVRTELKIDNQYGDDKLSDFLKMIAGEYK